ncbi:MAG: penicillin-binding protein 2 [Gammaproteobacteria bacterium]|nr:penicillin-binding protein 2 [Gammaproteobacteria bacterium]
MYNRTPIKNHIQEIQLINQRCIAVLLVMIILVLFLILRLGYLQLSKHLLYNTLSQQNSLDLIPIEPTRGLIYDRNGVLLAENIPVFSLDIIPYKVENLPTALAEIGKIIPLNDTDIVQLQKQLKQHRRFDEIPLKLKLSEEEVAKFAENLYRFPGFVIKARLIRHYPFDASLSHVLGYVGRINIDELDDIDTTNYSATNYIGKLGIEKYYEDDLHGKVGYEQVENDASGEPVRVLNQIAPQGGKNLYLTLDSKLQFAAEKALEGMRGAVVAIQPKTGEVLALVSQPSYDPNAFVSGISTQNFQTLQDSPDRPLYNRALRGLYPLASTIKPFIALEGLNSGITNPSFTLFDPGWYQLKNSEHLFHDWRHHGHGNVNLNRAITCSCDTYFYDLASKLGIQRIDNVLTEFGFGELSGIDLDEELPGIIASPVWKKKEKHLPWYPGDTVLSGIGQGYMQATPLQLAVGIATLANRGQHFIPHLILKQQQQNKTYLQQQATLNNSIELTDKNYWNVIITAMQNVITSSEGTGYHHFGHTLYTVAAKTGTAQVYTKKRNEADEDINDQFKLPEKLRDHSLFIAFAPVEDPKIAIAVVVENSKLASGVARKIMDYYLLQELKVVPAQMIPGSPLKKMLEPIKNSVDASVRKSNTGKPYAPG